MSTATQTDLALGADLELAQRVQRSLLPKPVCCLGSWTSSFSYEPAATVGGDYLDLISSEAGDFYFALGDVSGKV